MFSVQTKIELKKGNPESFKEVFLVLYPRLKGADKNLVEDIIQETFLTLWEKRDLIKTEKTIESLIFVMVRNRCLNELRKKRMESGRIDPNNIKVAKLNSIKNRLFQPVLEKQKITGNILLNEGN